MKIEYQCSTKFQNVITALESIAEYVEKNDLIIYDFGDIFGCKVNPILKDMLENALENGLCKRVNNTYYFEPTKCFLDNYAFTLV